MNTHCVDLGAPMPPEDLAQLEDLCVCLEGVGLDWPELRNAQSLQSGLD